MTLPTYKWKKPPKVKWADAVHRAKATAEGVPLTGMVRGMEASEHEEYFANSLNKLDIPFDFQPSYVMARNLPGEIRVDFMLMRGPDQPVQIDGAFAHKTSEQREEDKVKDAILDEVLKDTGALPTVRIDAGTLLSNQEDSDAYVEEHFA